jgi:hypothetical protein
MNLCCADYDPFTTASAGLLWEPSKEVDSRPGNW